MVAPLVRVLTADKSTPLRMIPCTITDAGPPLRVDLGDGTPVPATRVQGQTYTVGAPAIAFLNPADLPVVLAIG